MEKILEVKDLSISFNTYAGKINAVRKVNFYLNKGETLVMVGESGCGKTVMAKSIIKLLPELITEIGQESEIIFDKKNILDMSEKELEKLRGLEISMIFQDPMTFLNPTMTIGEQIAESLIIHNGKIKKQQALEETIKILRMVNIPNPERRIKQYPHEFSGGMRQRTMIAMALLCRPKILIADEPTTALDVTIQADIMELINELQSKLKTSILLITHDLGVAFEVADRIQVMYAGEIIETGTKEEIFLNPQHPYTWALLQSIPKPDAQNKSTLYSLDGTPPDLLEPPTGCPFAARCEYCMKVCKRLKPQFTKISDTQEVACWLKHPLAPEVEISEVLRMEG
ncbi:ABC transporter ATP-binding protein [Sporanaerobacter acetigenes]|uniref:Oligopeptide transport system ATP-binding protein n=1 Tax=Sporanaerobacter acetigenes DSM 13106 TaxID=1123281 RepID=A0A1M5VP26_9FIRM|nr:ABC transporter ATP-binding protein [Sporanaerobacter acetigenes]SHH77041.1 oligopeptide transport system ATP-binding protein [Sporanaerobacter acetigenes DSM 13106]